MPLQPAVLGSARLNNFRLAYIPEALNRTTRARILINGVDVTGQVRKAGMTIHDQLNDAPNTCAFSLNDTITPVVGQSVRVTINADAPLLLFNGTLATVDRSYEGRPIHGVWRCTAVDDQAQANRRLPFGTWTNVSASTVAAQLVASYAPGMTATHIEAGLPTVSVIYDGSEGMSAALAQIASLIGGYYYWEDGDLHLFQDAETGTPPDPLDGAHDFLDDPPITTRTDASQLRTRVYGKGHGELSLYDTAAGSTVLAVANAAAWFSASGGRALVNTQQLTYTGLGYGWVEVPVAAWTVRTPPPTGTVGWSAIAWSPELRLFVAVGTSTTNLDVMTSPDGITWTQRTPAVNTFWTSVCWSAEQGLFVAVGSAGSIMTSPDGITWTQRTSPEANTWEGICWAAALGLFVVVGQDGTHQVLTSPDGLTWTVRTAASNSQWQKVAWSPELGLLAAVALTSPFSAVMTSPDGVTWTLRGTPSIGRDIAWSPTRHLFVAADVQPFTSPDGITWTQRTVPVANTWAGVCWSAEAGLFVAVALNGTANAAKRAMSSPDGLTWTAATTPNAGTWTAVVWSPRLRTFVAVANNSGDVRIMSLSLQIYETLIGIPASGPGAITAAIPAGSTVNLWVQRDDLAAQAALAAATGGDGIVEYLVSDERRNEASLTALCDAYLALYSRPIETVTYATHDTKTKSGKPIVVDLADPPMATTLTIQDVTITEIDQAPHLAPRFTVTASSVRFSLDAMLRQLLAFMGESNS